MQIPPFTVLLAAILLLLPGTVFAYQAPFTVRPVGSTPIRLEDLEFAVVTQDKWLAFRYSTSQTPSHRPA